MSGRGQSADDAPAVDPPADAVAAQYEAYPYPGRDPREEAKRLVLGSPSDLRELDHYLFAGRRDWRAPFRALIAGGGTGDAAIMLAQQLADLRRAWPDAGAHEVVYLDLSAAARRIAEARARVRGLDNLRFVTGSLLDLGRLGLGAFDYIDCCGVLHHLEEPAAGLAALAAALAPGGGIGLMLYGRLGRAGVYELQELLRTLAPPELGLPERIARTRRLLAALPPSHPFRRNPALGDHKRGDAELVDLLLHARDRAYDVTELAALVAGAGLRIAAFVAPARYEPASYLADPQLLRPLAGLDPVGRAAAAERLAGNMKAHIVYTTSQPDGVESCARIEGPSSVPILRELDGPTLARGLPADLVLRATFDGLGLRFPLPRLARPILERIDGRRDLGAIWRALRERDPALGWEAFARQFAQLFAALGGINHLLLRNPPAGGPPPD